MAEKNVHSGHRARLKERFLREGLSGFEKHNVLELLLFYSIPQRDTNPIAHALINRFGSLRGVFEASFEELCEVDGVSEHTATLIKLVPSAFASVAGEVDTTVKYDSLSKIARLLVKRYAGMTKEMPVLVLLDNSWRIIDIVNLEEGSVNQSRLDLRKIAEYCIKSNTARVVVAHNHPNGSLFPSNEDITATEMLSGLFHSIKVDFMEHLIIAGDQYDALLSKNEGYLFQRADREKFYR